MLNIIREIQIKTAVRYHYTLIYVKTSKIWLSTVVTDAEQQKTVVFFVVIAVKGSKNLKQRKRNKYVAMHFGFIVYIKVMTINSPKDGI